MIVIGLTGSISMGKSVAARQFTLCGADVCDSDRLVHRLLGKGGAAVEKVGALFPGALAGEAINRAALGREVFGDPGRLKQLEAILHPMVRRLQEQFLTKARIHRRRVVVLDIPLLFETRAEKRCDCTVVATAPAFLQRQRALRRPGMTREKLARILAQQMPDAQKRKRADFIIFTGIGKYNSLRMVKRILRKAGKWR
jgi:dephospho-CoA kinase